MEAIIRESGKGKYAEEITLGKHVITADEPIINGGNDTGPSPYDLLIAALGACTSITLRMYADSHKIPLETIVVNVKHEKIHAANCVDCEKDDAKIDLIERKITLKGNLSQEQRAKLLDIANKCPVHRTLMSKIIIDTHLAD